MNNKNEYSPHIVERTNEADLLRLALLKERAAYRAFWKEHPVEQILKAYERFLVDFEGRPEDKIIICKFNSHLYKFGIRPIGNTLESIEESLKVLDPFSDNTPTRIPFDFKNQPSIVEFYLDELPDPLGEIGYVTRLDLPLKPSERLLKVDLSRKRSELLAEFTHFLDAVDYFRQSDDVSPNFTENYKEWNPDRTRFVKEAWRHLEVWQLRRQRQPFFEISRITGLSVDTAKKSFARAYELIEGRQYNPEGYRELYKEIITPELKKTCATCSERDTCSDLCPDVLAFIDQDYTSLHERLTPTRK